MFEPRGGKVLKTILKGLTKTQAATMARMPRERLLSTIAAHRESHRVAHESLARLGHLLKELQVRSLMNQINFISMRQVDVVRESFARLDPLWSST